jgi:hypothetical protein
MRGNQLAIAIGSALIFCSFAVPAVGIYWTALAIGIFCVIAGWLNRPER